MSVKKHIITLLIVLSVLVKVPLDDVQTERANHSTLLTHPVKTKKK